MSVRMTRSDTPVVPGASCVHPARRSLIVAICAVVLACGGDGPAGSDDADATADVTPETGTDVLDDGAPADVPADGGDAADTPPDGSPDGGDASDTAPDAADTPAEVEPDTRGLDPTALTTLDEAMEAIDVFIGGGGVAFGYASLTPAAQRPLGLVVLGPDTTIRGSHAPQNHFSGYYDLDPDVRGFSHLHLVGTGAADLGNLRVLPLVSLDDTEPWRRWTALPADAERARPGLYEATLHDGAVEVALTVTEFGAVHQYTFDGVDRGWIQIDPASSVTDTDEVAAEIAFTDGEVVGEAEFRGGYVGRSRPFTLYFVIRPSEAPASVQVWDGDGTRGGTEAAGSRAGVLLGYDEPETIELRVGLSLVDLDNARANLAAEIGDRSFDDLVVEADGAWREKLRILRVAGGTERQRRILFSALYNTYRMPTRLDEPDGRYRGLDGEVHEIDDGAYYTNLSLWDTFRTLHPWWELVDPVAQRDSLRSLLLMYEQGGQGMPRWPAMLSYTRGMIGESADILFGGSAAKGLDGIDWDAAFDALWRSNYGRTFEEPVPLGRDGVDDYVTLGYLPIDRHGEAVSKTLEYAWNDFGLANLAALAGRPEEEALLRDRSRGFMNLYDPDSGFLMPRNADGSFVEGLDPIRVGQREGAFTEGSAWHWRFYAFHDPQPLVDALGEEAFTQALEDFFTRSALGRPGPVSTALPDPYYWHGNEPAIHVAYLFHAVDRYDRVAHWVREIQLRLYGDGPDGLPGNDDGGTMSSWFLFSALGLYPVAGSDLYVLGTPLFPLAELDLGDGSTLTIEAPGADADVRYVRSVTLNGERVEGDRVRHVDLSGSTLRFEMSATP